MELQDYFQFSNRKDKQESGETSHEEYFLVYFGNGAGHTLKKRKEKKFSDYFTELLATYKRVDRLNIEGVSFGLKNKNKKYVKLDHINMEGNFIATFPKSQIEEVIDNHMSATHRPRIKENLEKHVMGTGKVLATDAFKLMFSLPLKEYNH